MKLIMENWRLYRDQDFTMLCENHDKGIISEERLIMLWEENTNREYQQLLNEGIMDILSIGYEKGKQLVGKAKETYNNALAKVDEYYIKILNQAWLLTQKVKQGIGKLAKVLKNIQEKVSAFCEVHPIVCTAAKILIVLMVVAGAVALFKYGITSAAADGAKDVIDLVCENLAVPIISAKTGKKIIFSADGINALKSIVGVTAPKGLKMSPEVNQAHADAFRFLEDAQNSETVVDLASSTGKSAEMVKNALETLTDLVDNQGYPLEKFIWTGERCQITIAKDAETITQATQKAGLNFSETVIDFETVTCP